LRAPLLQFLFGEGSFEKGVGQRRRRRRRRRWSRKRKKG